MASMDVSNDDDETEEEMNQSIIVTKKSEPSRGREKKDTPRGRVGNGDCCDLPLLQT
jgi:hypothetical protein